MDGQLSGGGVSAPKKGGFEVAETWFDKVVVVSVSGVLDLLTAPHLGEAIDAAASKTPAGVIVDLSKVEFLASAEMAALATAHREITQFARFGVESHQAVAEQARAGAVASIVVGGGRGEWNIHQT